MADCIRTRTRFSTPLNDLLWNQANERQTRYIAAQEAARLHEEQVSEVSASFTFSRADDLLFRFTASGVCTQAAMTLTDGTEKLTVVGRMEENEETVWFITDMTGLCFPASVYIQAVKARIEANRSRKAVN